MIINKKQMKKRRTSTVIFEVIQVVPSQEGDFLLYFCIFT